jgi:hypothetical protein
VAGSDGRKPLHLALYLFRRVQMNENEVLTMNMVIESLMSWCKPPDDTKARDGTSASIILPDSFVTLPDSMYSMYLASTIA